MLKERVAAADAIAQAIRPAERSIEIAAIEASRVASVMMQERMRLKMGCHVGSDAVQLASKASALLIEALGAMAAAHQALGPVIAQTGLSGRESMYGCEEPPSTERERRSSFFTGATLAPEARADA